MITKEVNLELAGQMASAVNCKTILIDTEQNHNLIVDAVDSEGKVYYQDIAIDVNDLPFTLTQAQISELSQ